MKFDKLRGKHTTRCKSCLTQFQVKVGNQITNIKNVYYIKEPKIVYKNFIFKLLLIDFC